MHAVSAIVIAAAATSSTWAIMYTPVLATLGYVLSADQTQVLLIHRNTRPDDPHFGKYNGLGGKLERNEDIVTGMKRELLEEAGIDVVGMRLRGTVSWPGFGKNGEDWFAFIFLIDSFRGEVRSANAEGTLEWVPVNRLAEVPMWDGDRYFLSMVFEPDGRTFHGVMPYQGGQAQSWQHSRLK